MGPVVVGVGTGGGPHSTPTVVFATSETRGRSPPRTERRTLFLRHPRHHTPTIREYETTNSLDLSLGRRDTPESVSRPEG